MVSDEKGTRKFECRRALEALRNGVPNRDAVKILGCSQPDVESRFDEMLSQASNPDRPTTQCHGDGGFRGLRNWKITPTQSFGRLCLVEGFCM